MLCCMSGDRPPPWRVFLSHTSELRRLPTESGMTAWSMSVLSRARMRAELVSRCHDGAMSDDRCSL